MKWLSMKPVVVQGVLGESATHEVSFDVCISVGGSGMMKYPFKVPVIPGFTTPEAGPDSHAPGLKLTGGESIASVEKLPSLNCSTIVIPLG